MKTINYFGVVFAVATLAACSNERELDYSGATPISVLATVQGVTSTRTIDDGSTDFQDVGNFVSGEEIAVYIEESELDASNNIIKSTSTGVTDYCGTNGYPLLFKPNATPPKLDYYESGTVTPLYFPTSGKGIMAYGFYPYAHFASLARTTTSYEFAVETNQEAIADYRKSDLMAAKTAAIFNRSDVTATNPAAKLEFDHKLAKVNIVVLKGAGMTDALLDGAVVKINGLRKTAKFNISTQSLILTTDGTNNIADCYYKDSEAASDITVMTLPNTIATTGLKGSAIVVPQVFTYNSTTPDPFITITLAAASGGGSFMYKPTANITLAPGNEYTYTLTIKPDVLEVSGTINNWSGTSTNTASEDAKL